MQDGVITKATVDCPLFLAGQFIMGPDSIAEKIYMPFLFRLSGSNCFQWRRMQSSEESGGIDSELSIVAWKREEDFEKWRVYQVTQILPGSSPLEKF